MTPDQHLEAAEHHLNNGSDVERALAHLQFAAILQQRDQITAQREATAAALDFARSHLDAQDAAARRYDEERDERAAREWQDAHPERYCHRCGGPNIAWSAPSPLWNAVVRGGSINGDEMFNGIVCPVCFAQLAEAAGIANLWRLHAERVHVELEAVTPSGRVWNENTWMWEEPEPATCTCPLIDISGADVVNPQFLRGDPAGCPVHGAERDAAIEAAKERERQRPHGQMVGDDRSDCPALCDPDQCPTCAPPLADMVGAIPDLTGGLTPEEYLADQWCGHSYQPFVGHDEQSIFVHVCGGLKITTAPLLDEYCPTCDDLGDWRVLYVRTEVGHPTTPTEGIQAGSSESGAESEAIPATPHGDLDTGSPYDLEDIHRQMRERP